MNTKNLFTKQPSKKLENFHIDKYQVKKIISNHIIKLNLFNNLYIYFIFYVNLLKLAVINDLYFGYVQFLGLPIKFDKKIKYEITTIVNSRFFRRIKKL